jgi:glycosyltransferase involved in cell wall biosynthesis
VKADGQRISVVIPVYNHGRYLAEAIESVLAQTLAAWEIIVIDSSTDKTPAVAKRFVPRIRYFYSERKGLGDARNRGIEAARGNFIAHLDADDIWLPEKLAIQAEAFAARQERDLVGAYVESFFSPELEEEARARIQCPAEPLPGLAASALMIRREVYARIGPYETHWRLGADLNWLTRVREAGLQTSIVPQVLVRRRLHAQNSGLRDRAFARERVLALKQALDRRRKAMGGKAEGEGSEDGP